MGMGTTRRFGRVARRACVAAAMLVAGAFGLAGAQAQPSGQPIRIGSTLALTGPLAATGIVHKIVGEIYVEQLNKGSGLLGRPVEWVLLDDQSKPDLARTLYERLITVDKVDLVLGPYATGAILSAMAVAERHDNTRDRPCPDCRGPSKGSLGSGGFQFQPAVALVDLDRRAVVDRAGEDLVGQRVLQIFLHRALQRPRAVDRVVADAAEPGARRRRSARAVILRSSSNLLQPLDLDVDDRPHVRWPTGGGTG